ncbi:ATP-dependent DNA helicase DDX11 isoform X4 [Leptopilina heterotoma]|uniref:ATP-dependent DNA helicase DDX11 isoform X4 n=1 Tax=Leptopilina heterotoma TaxID=63436 RepID=UPI001CA7EC8A|nr:ATP-dependent DNA helicase DDX11 isoform X4 [Leptopilina heterotoma]
MRNHIREVMLRTIYNFLYILNMETPENFPFPFPPYPIQNQFMKQLYQCLENSNLGIFESPTGTGKSLSIICGAVKWLLDHELHEKNNLITKIKEINDKIDELTKECGDDWFSLQTQQLRLTNERQLLQAKLDAMVKFDEKKNKLKQRLKQEKKTKKPYVKSKIPVNAEKENLKTDDKENPIEDINDQDLLLNEANSESDASDEDESLELYKNCKIFFCSRTHSQLSQFVGELKSSPYSESVSVVPLASRQNYCINKFVKKLRNVNMINDQCLQFQRRKTTSKKEKTLKKMKSTSGCPFKPGDQELLLAEILTNIQDVEEIASKGEEINTCSYYASRKSVEDGQIILVPYNSILHKNTRDSSGINLKNNILIIDEAHNLLEAIERMHSITITGRHIFHCYNQVSQYQKRFQALFSAKSVMYLTQLTFCLKKLLKMLGGNFKSQPNDSADKGAMSKLYTVRDFEMAAELDTVNIFHLLDFIKNSKLIHKLRGYADKYENGVVINTVSKKEMGVKAFLNKLQDKEDVEEIDRKLNEKESDESSSNPLIFINSFLEYLLSKNADGRVFVIPGATVGQGTLKFLLLNPAAHFHDIVQEARAVVLAGGTMEPMSEFKEQLFIGAGANPERIMTFSCDHVIPKENILTNVVTKGPTGIEFEFNYQNRGNDKMLSELGRTLQNICNIVPAGIVVFLPSYSYEELLYKYLENSGVLAKLGSKKCIFREPKLTSQVNQVLEKYAQAVKNPVKPQNGSLLFSVVGGKLSEGLNFSDDLGRCIIVVGMPYPNIKSPELQEKMKYLNESVKPGAGNIFYENSCMKAVNQCIGRAVRHSRDYSTVILLDKRYSNKISALPGWIQRTVAINTAFGSVIGSMAKFFAEKRAANQSNFLA